MKQITHILTLPAILNALVLASALPPGTINANLNSDGTDQSSKLKSAIDTVRFNETLHTVYIPAGNYYIADVIFLRPGVNLVGDGQDLTVFERNNGDNYLVKGKYDLGGATISKMTFKNEVRTLLIERAWDITFTDVKFYGGVVRFEDSKNVLLDNNNFVANQGKAGYASAYCNNMTITNNHFDSTEQGSINLSTHNNSYVANNFITSSFLLESYAGIRLPNEASNNLVENNIIENHSRGIHVLSSSTNNTIRNNIIRRTLSQGMFIQSSYNLFDNNTIIDAGDRAIYVVDATAPSSPTPSVANINTISNNIIMDTEPHPGDHFIGLEIHGNGNVIKYNTVFTTYGRAFKIIFDENIDFENSANSAWITITYDDFEDGWGSFQDGGSDARRNWRDGIHAHQGGYAIRIRDNTSTSVMTQHSSQDISQYSELRVTFWFKAVGMEQGEEFQLQSSVDGGGWVTEKSWSRGTDFENDQFYKEIVNVTKQAGSSMQLRFKCDATANDDKVYIDEVLFEGKLIS